MAVTQTANPATPETVWAALQEFSAGMEKFSAGMEKISANIDRFSAGMDKLKERQEETNLQMKETDRKIAELRENQKKNEDEFNKKFGKFTSRMGEIIESMVAPNLRIKFREFGLNFPSASRNVEVDDFENNIHFEIDVKLENGDKAMLVEVKTKLTTENVNEHIEHLEKMRKYADLHSDKRTFLGAVAGAIVTDNVKQYALKQGFYVIEPSGESFNIIPPENKPKEW